MASSPEIFLPLHFEQLVDLIHQLPQKEKLKIMEVLKEDQNSQSFETPEWQKKFVRKSIAKYSVHPEQLIAEEEAWKIIESDADKKI